MIDDQLSLKTPEGVTIQLCAAGPVPRLAAWAIDLAIRALVLILLAVVFAFIPSVGGGLLAIIAFLLEWFYPVLFETLANGQTPGKKVMGLVVVHRNGSPVTLNGSVIRNLLRVADFLPFLFTAGFVSMLVTRHFQRLGDLAADTLVIYRDDTALSAARARVEEMAPDWQASREDQKVLVSFLERGEGLTRARRQELAQLAWPEYPAQEAERRALGTARHMVGEQ